MDTVIDMPAAISTARPVSHGLRESLAWNLRLAMRDGLDEQIRTSTGTNRDTAANAVYQASVGYPQLEPLFTQAVQAYARGDTYGRIGELFADFLRQASTHYVEKMDEAIKDRERPFFFVTFERAEK